MPQIIFIADPEGVARFFNSRWHEYTGCDPHADARAAWDMAPTDTDLRKAAQAWRGALAAGDGFEIECQLRRYDGQYRWHLARALPIREEDGRISQWIGTYTDIHDRRSFEDRLMESEARFRKLCETVPAMIWMSDAQGNCVYWNPRWTEFTGQTTADAVAGGWWEVVHPDDLARVRHGFLQALDERRAFSAEYRVRRHDGEYRWCMDTATTHFGVDGSFLGHIGSLMDISERKRIEDATASERSILGLITTGAPLPIVLDSIALSVEARGERSLRCSIMLANPEQTLLRAVPPPRACRWSTRCASTAWPSPTAARRRAGAPRARPTRSSARTSPATRPGASTAPTPWRWASPPATSPRSWAVMAWCSAPWRCTTARRTCRPCTNRPWRARPSHLAGIGHRAQPHRRPAQGGFAAGRDQRPQRGRDRQPDQGRLPAALSHELRTPLNAILGWSRA